MFKFLLGLALGVMVGRSGKDLHAGRPIAKGLIKSGLRAFDKGIEAASHIGEAVEDIVAEAKWEMEQESPPKNGEKTTRRSRASVARKKT
jgi:Protein of unknown function (DUF5132)